MYNKEFELKNVKFKIDDVLKTAHKAGCEIMKIYNRDFEVEYKDDSSPLTEADKKSHDVIIECLKNISGLPVLSEEGKNIPYEERKNWEFFWMIDPIDGTKEFIKKNGEFTVNIALIHEQKPVFGVVYAPAINTVYFTDGENSYKAFLNTDEFELESIEKLPHTKENKDVLRVVASKSHLNDETKAFIDKLSKNAKNIELVSKGSSLKLCMVAEGEADIYPRIAPTMEWDTAAADAVVRKAGKMAYVFNDSLNEPVKYNKENLLNPYFIVK